MKKLYILRHAKSDYPDDVEDHERPLNIRGERACVLMGRYFKEHKIKPEIILSSDSVRTSQTINNILREAGSKIKPEFSSSLYLATPGEMLKQLASIDDAKKSAMLVCHSPGVQLLSAAIVRSGDPESVELLKSKFPTAGMACLSIDTDNWKKISPGCGHLDMFITPSMIGE